GAKALGCIMKRKVAENKEWGTSSDGRALASHYESARGTGFDTQ
ncbi:337_t:CDS:2, partial [Racocetra persica]